MIKKRLTQLTDSITGHTVDLTANNNLIGQVLLFSKKEDRVVGFFHINGTDGQLDFFKKQMEEFTKLNTDAVVLTSRNNVVINDNNYFACIDGKWDCVGMSVYANISNDINHLFALSMASILRTSQLRYLLDVNGSSYGLTDRTLEVAYHAGKNQVIQQHQINNR